MADHAQSTNPPRPLRADAARNRARILAAAREQITAHGPEVGMDAIAAAAGVAVGTLYRHFPTKNDLVSAVVSEHVDRLAQEIEAARARVEAGADAVDEILDVLAQVVEAGAADRAVKATARQLGAGHDANDAEQRAAGALAALLRRAQADGDVHPDVTIEDIYLLFDTAPTDKSTAERERWMTLVARALTTSPRRPRATPDATTAASVPPIG